MADETRAELLEAIKTQGEVVRQLKSTKADPSKAADVHFKSQLAVINTSLGDISYIGGWVPSCYDKKLYDICVKSLNGEIESYPHLKRWFVNVKSYDSSEQGEFVDVEESCMTILEGIVEQLGLGNFGDTGSIDKKVRQ